MSRTLEQLLLTKKYRNVNVKIGSKNGSSFWYCGKGHLAIPEIRKIKTQLKRQSHKTLADLKERLENLDDIYEQTFEIAKTNPRIKSIVAYEKTLMKRKEIEKKKLPIKIASVEYDIAVSPLDREVLEIVEGISPDEKPCWIIYIKGNEKGSYWTVEEYKKRREQNDNKIFMGR